MAALFHTPLTPLQCLRDSLIMPEDHRGATLEAERRWKSQAPLLGKKAGFVLPGYCDSDSLEVPT